jgi:diguanylate cyclase (GGDEF)-like protein
MHIKGIFFSLRWKLAILFGSVFLILHSVFSYFSYLEAIDNFELDRKKIQSSHINIAKALTEDSFLVLEQFGELLSLIDVLSSQDKPRYQVLSVLDETLSKWQFSWDMENVTYFDNQAQPIKSWGSQLVALNSIVKKVLRNEAPEHQVFCPHKCFQQTVTPVMGNSETSGAFSVIRSFADVIIKYKRATQSDIGLLIVDEATEQHQWPYKLSGMTLPEKNGPVFDYISRHFTIDELLDHSKTISLNDAVFEVRVFPVHQETAGPPFFLFVDDITADFAGFNEDLKQVWFHGVISFLASLMLLIVVLHFSLRRVTQLSQSLPLLSQNQYEQFKKQVTIKAFSNFGYDELDKLNHTALTLSDQLEHLELEVRSNTLKLLEKSQALGKERDFVRQLVDVAPIIIITQKLNGMILTINQAGADEFESDSRSIIGKVFDAFLPESDKEHLDKLSRLRAGDLRSGRFQVDGLLLTESGKLLNVSWLHTLLKSVGNTNEVVILTLGVDISACKIAEEKSLRMPAYDYLTGLSNSRKFQEELVLALASAQRYDYQVALVYMDLDHYKAINDCGGHEGADQLLVRISSTLKNTLRATDLLSRVGDNEFAVVMPHADLEGIECIAKKINEVFMALDVGFAGKKYQVSASLGIAFFPQHGMTPNELLANANFAMCQAKAMGGGQYHVFSPDFDYQVKLNRMLYWQATLEDAIANDKFVLFYQPILNIKTNVISHFECLIRLQLDDEQLIMPADFIGHAEELGLSGQIDRLVLKKVVKKHIEYERQGQDYKLTVNLSGHSFNDPTLFEDVSQLINMPEVDPAKIIFEITETAAVSNFAAAKILIDRIKALGCVFALDDFGGNFSSFYYLRHFPVDYVKIDGSFIRQIDKREDDKIFVKALAGVAHAFGKKIVAEFIENEAILTILKEFGIDYAQGYHIGRPRRAD